MWRNSSAFLKWLVIAGVTGGIGGLVGSAFHLSVNWAATFRAARVFCGRLLPVGGLLIAAIYRLTKMENKNTNAIIDAIHFGDKVPLLLVPAIYLSTVITHLFGGSAGREGAALQIGLGGLISRYIGRLFHLDEKDMRIATLCGMSAVFSALFGTPLTATIFALEVISVGVFYYSALVPCIVASLAALAIANAFGIAPTQFTFAFAAAPKLLLLRVAALAAVCSLMSILFCVTMHGTERLFSTASERRGAHRAGGRIVIVLSLLSSARKGLQQRRHGRHHPRHRGRTGRARRVFSGRLLFTAVTIGGASRAARLCRRFHRGHARGHARQSPAVSASSGVCPRRSGSCACSAARSTARSPRSSSASSCSVRGSSCISRSRAASPICSRAISASTAARRSSIPSSGRSLSTSTRNKMQAPCPDTKRVRACLSKSNTFFDKGVMPRPDAAAHSLSAGGRRLALPGREVFSSPHVAEMSWTYSFAPAGTNSTSSLISCART